MKTKQTTPQTIDAYIAGCPPDIQVILQKIRATIPKAAPQAAVTINYQMPTFTLHGNLVHFAGFQKPHWVLSHPDGNCEIQKVAFGL